jgi:hypothetical protein
MDIISFGKIIVPTPGTPVPVTADATIKVHAIVVSQIPGSTGITYFGLQNAINPTFSKTTGAGVLKSFLPPGASGFTDERTVTADERGNALVAADFKVDAAVANEGLYAYGIRV